MPNLNPVSNPEPNEILYQRRCAKYVYVVPTGLRELMSDISREVLRTNPTHLCTYIADYLESLMITRENARIAMKFVHKVTETGAFVANLLTVGDITRSQADKAATIIQKAFREFLKRKKTTTATDVVPKTDEDIVNKIIRRAKITVDEANYAATIIQQAYRKYKKSMEQAVDNPFVDWRLATRNTLGVYRSTRPPKHEMTRAATLIKAAYKGYYTRRVVRDLLEYGTEQRVEAEDIVSDELPNPEEQERAAIIIQRCFRRYLQRKRSDKFSEKMGECTDYDDYYVGQTISSFPTTETLTHHAEEQTIDTSRFETEAPTTDNVTESD